jgi:hypothetical protein
MGPASPLETPAASHTRRSLALYSLRRWALQYHGKLEIAVVGALKEDVDSVVGLAVPAGQSSRAAVPPVQ